MILRSLALIGLALLPSLAWSQLSFGTATLINDDWRFVLADDPQASQPKFNDGAWEAVTLPHDWSVRQPLDPNLASSTGYLPGGIGWYRKTLTLPARKGGERVYLYFEGIYNRSDVYLNGQLLGHRPNGYVSFYYDATPHVRFGGENVLAVRVDHSRSADSRWYTGSGIYRNVYLVRAGDVHIAPWGVFARPGVDRGDTAVLQVETEIQNHSRAHSALTVKHELLAADGKVVATTTVPLRVGRGSSNTTAATLEVRDPQRWSVDHPYLYQLRTTLLNKNRTLDQTVTRTGLRTFTFDPNRGFFLNGVSMKMKGVCLHHDAGVLGAAVPREVWRTRLETLKQLGTNAIRTSHNPQAPDLYELCDELGLLVINEAFDEWEFPKRKWLRGWNVGEPGFQGSYDFFEEWSDRDLADMVRRDRNHVSVFAWSIGNEVDYPNDPYSHPILNGSKINQPMFGGYKPEQPDAMRLGAIAHRLAAVVKKYDPSRPVTAGLAGVVMSNETTYPDALDIVGYNYTEDRYDIDHQTYPERIIYGSENVHTLKAWRAVVENEHIFGQFLWTGIDYLGESRAWPSRGFYSGLIDLSGAIKPRGRFRETLWSEQPVIHLGTERKPENERKSIDAWPVWNYAPGTPVRVLCYTNTAQAALALNGRPVGEPKPYDPETGVIAWDLPFEAGTLEVVGLNEQGVEIVRTALRTAGAPATLQARAHTQVISRAAGVSIITLQLVDAQGVPAMLAENPVTCLIDGPARLLGLEAGNNTDMSDYTDEVHNTYRGRLVAYIQATGEPGEIKVRFATPGLPAATVSLQAQ
jgi:beta-galactosidase